MVILSNHVGLKSKSSETKDFTDPKLVVKKTNDSLKSGCGCLSLKKGKSLDKAKLTGKVTYLPESELNKLNPYLRSVAGKSILNLTAYNNTIKVYYATNSKQDTAYLNNWLNSISPGFKTESLGWDNAGKQLNQAALLLHATYLKVNIQFVTTYAAADFVTYNALFLPENFFGFATYPFELDNNPALNGKLSIALNATQFYGQDVPVQIGSFFFWAIIHEIGHTYGLAHPHDDGNNTTLMPGCSNIDIFSPFYNQGLFNTNNNLTTIMSYIQPSAINYIENNTIQWNTNLVQTLMGLDLQSYRFLYKATNNQEYIDNWLDLTCPINIVQTLISTQNGITLDLTQESDQNSGFNLCLDRYCVNPVQDTTNSYSMVSSSFLGYYNFPSYIEQSQSTYSASVLDKDSFIKQVNTDYQIFNVFAKTIKYNCLIKGTSVNPQTISIWLKCRISDYIVIQTPTKTTIQNRINLNVLTIENNALSTVSVNFGNNEPLPMKNKGKK